MFEKFTDEELTAQVKSGDERVREELLTRHKNLVKNCARKYFLIGGDVEDLIQIGMIALNNAIDIYDKEKGASFSTLAYGLINKKIITEIARANNQKQKPLNNAVRQELTDIFCQISPEQLVIEKENKDEFNLFLIKTLSKLELAVLRLYLQGHSYLEIATKLKKTQKTVDNALQRTKTKIRAALGNKG